MASPTLLQPKSSYSYQALPGYFVQSDPGTSDRDFDVFNGIPNLGLVSQDWGKLKQELKELNRNAPEGEVYKVLFVNRHGEGYHNQAKYIYGDQAWDCHYSMLYGDGNITWGPDPLLTERGLDEARTAAKAWAREVQLGAPIPQSYYSSPLSRSAATMLVTWESIKPDNKRFQIKELGRETIGLHTCDKRSTKRHIHAKFPEFDFEEGFAEEDLLWTIDSMETVEQTAYRIQSALDELFDHDSHTFIAISAHAGVITALQMAVNHRDFAMGTGGLMPLVLRLQKNGPQRRKPPNEGIGPPECETFG